MSLFDFIRNDCESLSETIIETPTPNLFLIKREDILIEARVLAVADALEDLTSHRTFRNLKQALDEIRAHRGSQYDPDAVDACLRLFNEYGK